MEFEDLALPHFDALYGFARRLAGNAQDAEDLVQETYLRAQKNFARFDFGTNLKAWMFRILRNIAIDHLRDRDALQAGQHEPYDDELCHCTSSTERLINAIDLKRALECLPDRFRVVVQLKDIEGFSYEEIADIMNFPVGTVMSRLHRGRRELFEMLGGGTQAGRQKKVVALRQ